MAWWKRPNQTLSNLAEAAAAGLPAFLEPSSSTSTVSPAVAVATLDSASSQIDLWLMATNDKITCGHFTEINDKMHFTKDVASTCQFWSEGVLSVGMAAFGLMGNLISIWVLSVPEMRCTAFNRLLLALAFIDCMFIGPGILIYIFEAFELQADWYNYLFPIVFYPCSEIALCSSIYMTVAIAVERFIGLCRPFQRLSSRACPAKAYILPVLGLSVLLNIPKFLEAETVVTYAPLSDNVTYTRVGLTSLRTHADYITYYTMLTRLLATGVFPLAMLAILNTKIYLALRKSKAQLRSMAIRAALPMAILGKPATAPSQMDLRIDSAPANWKTSSPAAAAAQNNGHHVNGARHLTHGNGSNKTSVTTPLTQTAAAATSTPPKSPRPPHPMNRSVSAAVVESTRHREPLARSQSTAATTSLHNGGAPAAAPPTTYATPAPANDLNLAPILFGVVIVFVLCNTLRVFLNMYDFSVVDEIISCEKKGVGRMPPAWIVCSVSVSHLLLMINSSVNFLVYCVAGSKFRAILYQQLSSVFKRLRPNHPPQTHQQQTHGAFAAAGNGGLETALLQQQPRRGVRVIGTGGGDRHHHPRIVEVHEATPV